MTGSATDIAIVGMAVRCPGADSADVFWTNLRDGVESISYLSDDDLEPSVLGPVDTRHPNFVRAGFFLADIDCFDAGFFNISPREAELMDPQHRLFLECAWAAMEDAGHDLTRNDRTVALYAGSTDNAYLLSLVMQDVSPLTTYQVLTGNRKDHLATRVSYKLNFSGESINVQTTCSTSLVAVHLACQSLLSGQSDVALAGGVAIQVPQRTGYLYQPDMIMSPDGHCRAFDWAANGTSFGSGLGIIVLKPLTDALADRDHVYAVIKGTAVNNDARGKLGYTAPSTAGQAAVISTALEFANVPADSISYVEAHGTGTPLGDPIEIEALTRAFRRQTSRTGYCAVGSVKTNIGHLDAAAGVVGMIKTALALEHEEIPPSLNFTEPNPLMKIESTPFYVNTRTAAWPRGQAPRRASVSSFGIGGTNAHAILEEAPQPAPQACGVERPLHLLTLSARGPEALHRLASRHRDQLRAQPAVPLPDRCFTASAGRVHFEHRLAILASSDSELGERLDSFLTGQDDRDGRWAGHAAPRDNAGLVWLFTGQGAQYPGMGAELYETQPTFRRAMDSCHDILRDTGWGPLLPRLLDPADELVHQTWFTQPALFSFEYALAELWLSWGIRPNAVAGHSIGEYVAACVAGVLTQEAALRLVAERGRLMVSVPLAGEMAAVLAGESRLRELMAPYAGDVDIAAVNGPDNTVVSGTSAAIRRLTADLRSADLAVLPLNASHAFHSPLVEPVLDEFEAYAGSVACSAPAIPIATNVSGAVIEAPGTFGPRYWREQLRGTVRFADALGGLFARGHRVFLEIGPHATLSGLGQRLGGTERLFLPSARRGQSSWRVLLTALARLYVHGYAVDWHGFDRDYPRSRASLPTYPFDRSRYWAGASPRPRGSPGPTAAPPWLERVRPEPQERARDAACLWRETLGVEASSPEDNFYELGGDSVLAVQLTARCREFLGAELPLRRFLERPTLAQFVALADEAEGAQAEAAAAAAIQPAGGAGETVASFAQRRLWFLDKLAPGNPFYNVPIALRLRGRLHVQALEDGLSELVRRHESLRTTFPSVHGQPAPQVAPPAAVPFDRLDLRGYDGDRRAEGRRLAIAEARRPFDLAAGPLLRSTLIQLDDSDHLLVLTIHHIVADAWSLAVVARELRELYLALTTGEPSLLPALPIQYADYARWQQDRADVHEADLAYWREQLLEAPPALALPADRPRRAVPAFRGARLHFGLPGPLARSLEAIGSQLDASLFMVLLAAFAVLLHRITGQDDILIGSPVSGRSRLETEGLIGLLANTVVFRILTADGQDFHDLLRHVRDVVLGGLEHQELPFERLVEALQLDRDLSKNPLFQANFVFQNAPGGTLDIPGLDLTLLELDNGTAKFDLMLDLRRTAEGIDGFFEYDTDIFDEPTIARLEGQFTTLLAGIAAAPGRRTAVLPILSFAEQAQLAAQRHAVSGPPPAGHKAHELFELQAARTPGATALAGADGEVTYAELNARANRLARRLRSLGIGPETPVGLHMESSALLVQAVLATLKAGGAYVPMLPDHPRDRLASIARDCAMPLVLTVRRLAQHLDAAFPARVLCLDEPAFQQEVSVEDDGNPGEDISAQQLAYIIYTSGSTGDPKGVMVHHQGLANYLAWCLDAYPVTAGCGTPLYSSFGFDLTVTSIYCPLLAGKTIFLYPEGGGADTLGTALAERAGYSLVKATPSHAKLLTSDLPAARLSGRAAAFVLGGERLRYEDLRPWRRGAPETLIVNEYGPTETVVGCCAYLLPQDAPEAGDVPIGSPIWNTSLHILDSNGQPVPVGVPGELCVGGVGVSRGYMGRAALTAEKFMPDPYSNAPGARLYRTGDLARRRPDGNLEYLGRIDRQLKIRGFRVEPGEVEAVLSQHPAVQQAAVVPQQLDGEQRLVAYAVPRPAGSGTSVSAHDTVGEWREVFDASYAPDTAPADPALDLSGWNNSYDGLPFPEAEMQEWIDRTVERILELQPSRVLEIGCGTGLILSRVAPHCRRYVASDLSGAALRRARQVISANPELAHVEVSERAADDFADTDRGGFDVVILNSVAQYFPNADYLLRVLRGATAAVGGHGAIFVGDVRSLPLLSAFHASVLLARSGQLAGRVRMRRGLERRVSFETELALDPGFFWRLFAQLPELTGVEVLAKRGHARNELTRFRYDAVLWLGKKGGDAPPADWLDWRDAQLTVAELRRHLMQAGPGVLAVSRVPDARALPAVEAERWLAGQGDAPGAPHEAAGVDPEELWALAQELGYRLDAGWWSGSLEAGYVDVVFRRGAGQATPRTALPRGHLSAGGQGTRAVANAPGNGRQVRLLEAQLRSHLRTALPGYMLPRAVMLVGELPLTSSGKLDSRALPALDTQFMSQVSGYAAPLPGPEATLSGIWRDVLGVARVGRHDNFFTVGGDSILSLQVIARAREAGLALSARQVFLHQTLAEMAAAARPAAPPQTEQEAVTGPVPLTPIQRWFFGHVQTDQHHWNQSVVLEIRERLAPDLLARSLWHLIAHHDALRMRYDRDGPEWHQRVSEPGDEDHLLVVDASGLPEDAARAAFDAAAAEAQASLRLSAGPLLRAVLMQDGARPGRLLIVAHHLVIDAYSWRILLADLQVAYRQISCGTPVSLPPKTTSFKEWAERLQRLAGSPHVRGQLDGWVSRLSARQHDFPLDFPKPQRPNTAGSARTITRSLDADATAALLHIAAVALRARMNEVLLAALLRAASRQTGNRALLIDVESHGRQAELIGDGDLSRTVGWFTAIAPAVLDLGQATDMEQAVLTVKEQLRALPDDGLGFGVLRYLSGTPAGLAGLPQPALSFNYLGHLDGPAESSALFQLSRDPAGPTASPRSERPHAVTLDAAVEAGTLRMTWTFHENLHRPQRMEDLADGMLSDLARLSARHSFRQAAALAPSDFPLAQLAAADLAELQTRYTDIADILPLTPAQRTWYAETRAPAPQFRDTYHLAVRLPRDFDVAAFREIWQETAAEHQSLRTWLAQTAAGQAVQVVLRHPHGSVRVLTDHDLRGTVRDSLSAVFRSARDTSPGPTGTPPWDLTIVPDPGKGAVLAASFHLGRLDVPSFTAILRSAWHAYARDVAAFRQSRPPGRAARGLPRLAAAAGQARAPGVLDPRAEIRPYGRPGTGSAARRAVRCPPADRQR